MASIAEACADGEIIHLSDHLVGGADSVVRVLTSGTSSSRLFAPFDMGPSLLHRDGGAVGVLQRSCTAGSNARAREGYHNARILTFVTFSAGTEPLRAAPTHLPFHR
eukprot:3142494-Prymnesium_polylepis.1